jgi:uncharacterized YccA/Bax inhibitor family protein
LTEINIFLAFSSEAVSFEVRMSYNTSNPVLNAKNFEFSDGQMSTTLMGVINRCLILLAIVVFAASFAWNSQYISVESMASKTVLFAVAGLVIGIVTFVKKEWAGYTTPLYAVFEGLVLGGMSKIFESQYSGIVFQAIALTFGTALAMLLLYKYNVISVTDKFRAIISAAILGIAVVYVVNLIVFTFSGTSFLSSNGLFGLLFNVFVVVIAALTLLRDFDFVSRVSNRGLPSYMGWFAAFGLMVTLIWLYIEILKLLSRVRRR